MNGVSEKRMAKFHVELVGGGALDRRRFVFDSDLPYVCIPRRHKPVVLWPPEYDEFEVIEFQRTNHVNAQGCRLYVAVACE